MPAIAAAAEASQTQKQPCTFDVVCKMSAKAAVPNLLGMTPASASTVCLTIELPPTVGPPTTPARRAVVRGTPEILFDYFAKSSTFRHA